MNKISLFILGLTTLILSGCTLLPNAANPTPVPVFQSATDTDATSLPSTQGSPATQFSQAEVAQHASPSDCWMSISGNVYDVTKYISSHPNDDILKGCGKDATSLFEKEREHRGPQAQALLPVYKIGELSK